MTTKRVRKNRRYRCLTAALLSGAMAVTSCLSGVDMARAEGEKNTKLQNPRVEMNTCDTVYFGHYWQEDTNGDGVADQNDEKTPIRWRILSQNGNDAYVMADQVLDFKQYHETTEDVNWETSTLRQWLNEEFYNTAFTAEEQKAVLEQTLANEDNEEYGTEGGADTVDKVYLPSVADMTNENYGFLTDSSFRDQARIGKATPYALKQRTKRRGMVSWLLRSPGHDTKSVVLSYYGRVLTNGTKVGMIADGVRPVLHLDLSSSLVLTGDSLNTSLQSSTWDLVKLGNYEGESIVWRVLKISENEVFLLSDQILTDRDYNEYSRDAIKWEDSALRTWLNDEFYQETFSDIEKTGVLSWEYTHLNMRGNREGENTWDLVTILSMEDIVNLHYGFPTDYDCEHQARVAYKKAENSEIDNGKNRGWWLRTKEAYAVYGGLVDRTWEDTGFYVRYYNHGVRPAMHFDISRYPLTKVGTVTAWTNENVYQWNNGENLSESTPPLETGQPNITQTQQPNPPSPTKEPDAGGKPNSSSSPSASNPPAGTEIPNSPGTAGNSSGIQPSAFPQSAAVQKPSTSVSKNRSVKNQPTKLNIKNKKKYSLSKKLTIRDADGIRSVKLNGKTIKMKTKKKSLSFKLSKYKKFLKKKGKWNRLVITDWKGTKKTVRFKIK